MMPHRIFHPTDFSASADHALRFAMEAALRFEAELLVGHVAYGGRAYWDEDDSEDDAAIHARLKEHVARSLADVPERDVERIDVTCHVVRHEGPAEGIHHFAVESGADLIVMGTHGRRGIRRLLLGSVAARVLHLAVRDVVLIPHGEEESRDGRIVVPVDLHDRSAALVETAAHVAEAFGRPMDLLHVLDAVPASHIRADSYLSTDVGTLHEVARDRLDDVAEDIDAALPVGLHVETGRPAEAILRWLRDHHASMVFVASSGMSPEERLRLHPEDRALGDGIRWAVGPVTERLSTLSPVPVWIAKRFAQEEVDDRHAEASTTYSR